MIRAVLDTNVLVAALRSSSGASHQVLLAADRGDFEVALSVPMHCHPIDLLTTPAMSTLSLRLPDSLHRNLKQAAEADGISINHFVSLAVAEKLSAMQTLDIISERAKGASRSAFLQAMSLVPRGEIIEGDEPRPKQRRSRGAPTGP